MYHIIYWFDMSIPRRGYDRFRSRVRAGVRRLGIPHLEVAVGKRNRAQTVTLSPDDMGTVTQTLRLRRASERRELPVLKVVAGEDMLNFCAIYPGERVTIGREPSCELQLSDVSVSREHAAIRFMPPDSLILEDLGSTNGTFFGEEPVSAPVTLQPGSEIQVGSVTLRVEFNDMNEIAHLARVLERLRDSRKDRLTGLLTRAHLEESLPDQLRRYERAHVPITAVFLDIDHFKSVNDTLGHLVGDEVLRTVARLLMLCTRESDMAIRYGGEEVVVILPNCDEAGGVAFAERVRTRVANHAWASHLECDAPKPGAPTGVTVSLGVAQYDHGELEKWLALADRALYAAKGGGRNQVVAASTL